MDEKTRQMWAQRPELERTIYFAWRTMHTSFGFRKRDAEETFREKSEEFFKYFSFPFSCEDYARLHGLYNPRNGKYKNNSR